MNKREYKKWTNQEKDQLIYLARQNISSTGKIYWDVVCPHFQGRTVLQCKNYYQNIIRPTLYNYSAENRVNTQNQANLTSKDCLNWSKSEGIRLSYIIALVYGPDIDKLHIFFQNRSKQELQKFIQHFQFYERYFEQQILQLSDGSYYSKNVSQIEMRILIGAIRIFKHRYQFISLGQDEKIPKLPQNLKLSVKQFLGTQISKLLSSRMGNYEKQMFVQADKLFGNQNIIDQLKVLEEHYKQQFGDHIF
ncbi:Myb-like_DNA-binding domain-containing protein [Hexamita inflata]|uniref:Myb-like DNA-binding domain-containing protein n=1 Tax=Hexamita inflata TaxID=28002 RepID=A0AA86UG82_9EUKA|nr:Myb-like DNA-binding domain-containing protein [Hexamita inflata]